MRRHLLPRYKDGTRYIPNDNGGWDRITNDDLADIFANFVVTPKGSAEEKVVNRPSEYNLKMRQKLHNAGYITNGMLEAEQRLNEAMNLRGRGEKGLETVSPEFDLLAISPVFKEGITYGGKKIADKLGFFVQKPGTYTRGIGMTDAGVRDAIETGVFRGNPRGTEQTARIFDKMYLNNRGNFRDIVEDTGIKGIESRYQSRTLTEKDFYALKQASKKYEYNKSGTQKQGISLLRVQSDPLHKYKNYSEYLEDISKTVRETNKMPQRIASGEVDVNNSLTDPMWFEDESGRMFLPQGRPIAERFGTNSDYVSDGNPLSYWYSDGRNAITDGHAYARSNYMVRVNNPQDYIPFMHELHMHPSFFKTPKLSDPNVELFRRGPFGITLRMRKP